MGLRQRTAICILRMQRNIAESKPQRLTQKPRLRSARHIQFSHIDASRVQRGHALSPHLNRMDQEDSLRLIQRLRQALQPITEQESQASKEYESLQDELHRLTQHIAQQKNRVTEAQILEDIVLPFERKLEADVLPYRIVKIAAPMTGVESPLPRRLERLDGAPSDLSVYRQNLPSSPIQGSAPNLSLVPPEKLDAPEAQDLLIDENVQLGNATAYLTQQSLETQGPRSVQVSIRPELALSLLDS